MVDFFENEELVKAMENCKKNDSALTYLWTYYQTVVYTAIIHIFMELLEMAKKFGLEKVYVHAFLDGRDTPPASGKDYVQELVDKMA